MTTLERNPSPTRKLRTIERLQGWSMLGYYPLEHLYYLLSHDIIPEKLALPSLTAFVPFIRTRPSTKYIPLQLGTLGLWSTRFWAAYVFLQLAHLREDEKLLRVRARTLAKTKVGLPRAYACSPCGPVRTDALHRPARLPRRRRSSSSARRRSRASSSSTWLICRRLSTGTYTLSLMTLASFRGVSCLYP